MAPLNHLPNEPWCASLGQGQLSPHPISRCHRAQGSSTPQPRLGSLLGSVGRRKEGEGGTDEGEQV